MKSDDQIFMEGGDEHDIEQYAKENGATDPRTLEEKIRSLVPELQELSFGCIVKTDRYDREIVLGNSLTGSDGVVHCAYSWGENDFMSCDVDRGEIVETIGHPITLEHAIVAVNRAEKYDVVDSIFGVWIPFKPLQDQSPETRKLLDEILL